MRDGGRLPEEWVALYDDIRPTYDAFTDKLETLIGELLDEYEIDQAWSYTWSMSEETFTHNLYEAQRHGRLLEDPLKELPGVAGVGIVVHDSERMQAVSEVVERELMVDDERSVSARDATRNLALAEGWEKYEFPQYVVSISEARAALPEWRPYMDLRVNVDIQTLLQYAWERAWNDLPYEHAESYPATIRERIAGFAAALAAADADLSEVWSELADLEAEYQESIGRGDLDQDLNGESLRAYLASAEQIRALVALGVEAGLQADEVSYVIQRGHLESGALWLLRNNGFRTIREVDEYVERVTERASQILGEVARLATAQGYSPWAQADSIVEWLLLVLRRADAQTISMLRYREEIDYALNTLIGNVVPSPEER